jgi:NAD(P)-dependent dehydrogenase (short-subunit alcohol dehydrogenase family)
MEQQTIIITGASDGIGAAAARQLSAKGERVVLTGRSQQKTAAVADELGAPYHLADYTDLDQVRDLASELRATYPRIDVLANNAGGIMGARELTKDGFEQTFQVNHLAPFLLTHLLMPTLITSQAKVLQTSSVAAQRYGHVDIDDLQNEMNYAPQKAYGTAKLENILFTRELHRRFHDQRISAAAFHPGVVATNFASDTTHLMRYFYHSPLTRLFTITPAQGAEPLVWLAEGTPGRAWQSGGYYAKNKPARTNAQAADTHLAQQLWDRSAAILKVWMAD